MKKPPARFGPTIRTEGVELPKAGVYLLMGQVARGQELILLPFFVECSGSASASTGNSS
jgi:hypothetical protein